MFSPIIFGGKMNFIKVDNDKIAQKMITAGFALIENTNGIWTFLNDSQNVKINFNKEDKKHMVYTDMLNV